MWLTVRRCIWPTQLTAAPEGKQIKRRFKRLVEHSKEEYITKEINADCKTNKNKSFLAKLMQGSK